MDFDIVSGLDWHFNTYMQDDLGNRMKGQYEDRTRIMLPRRTYTIIRLDGKAFHTYTRKLNKPFDLGLSQDMDDAIVAILPEIQGAVFAYTQSDEISILLIDFSENNTCAWFDNNLQKMCSVSASLITAEFNRFRLIRDGGSGPGSSLVKLAHFDSRVFTIPDRIEVMNYLIWRNKDCSRNSVSMVAQSMFSHNELHGKSTSDMHEMMHQKGVNWATDYSEGDKNGRLISKSIVTDTEAKRYRTKWVSTGAWNFTQEKEKLLSMIPKYE